MLPTENRGPVVQSIAETEYWSKSPFVQGFLAGVKGALVGAPAGALMQYARGKNPLVGALIGGLSAGAALGGMKALTQDVENVADEERLRYHALRLKGREPLLFMPPPHYLGHIFTKMHAKEHGGRGVL